MRICVITDDNSGFTKKEAAEIGIKVLRMPIIVDGEVFFQDENLSYDQFFKFLEEDKDIKTSQPSPGDVLKIWDEALKEYDAIIHIPMTSGLSESCHSAQLLAEQEEYKGKVFVVDNHRISITLKRSVYDALNLIKQGKNPAEIKQILEETKSDSSIFVMVDTLKYLKKGGRVTPAGAALGATLHVKPVLQIMGGKLDAYAKVMGVKKAKRTMLDAIQHELESKFKNYSKDELDFAVAYTYDEEASIEWQKEVEEKFGVTNTIRNPLSLSVSTHIGPGALAIAVSRKIN